MDSEVWTYKILRKSTQDDTAVVILNGSEESFCVGYDRALRSFGNCSCIALPPRHLFQTAFYLLRPWSRASDVHGCTNAAMAGCHGAAMQSS
jgi:hypothetical protein